MRKLSFVLLFNSIQGLRCQVYSGNEKGNGAGLAWKSQSHCFADEFIITHVHYFGTDTQHDYSQGNCRTMPLIIIKLE